MGRSEGAEHLYLRGFAFKSTEKSKGHVKHMAFRFTNFAELIRLSTILEMSR